MTTKQPIPNAGHSAPQSPPSGDQKSLDQQEGPQDKEEKDKEAKGEDD